MHPIENLKLGTRHRIVAVICGNPHGLHGKPAPSPFLRYIIISNGRTTFVDEPSWEYYRQLKEANPGVEPKLVVADCPTCKKYKPPNLKLLA